MPSLFSGGFVGAFRLRDVVLLEPDRWEIWRSAHLDLGRYQPNIFGWVIGQVARLRRPVAASGNQGLYRPAPSTLKLLLNEQFIGETESSNDDISKL